MTITTNDDRDEYTATLSQTVFNYTFKIFASTDLNVYQTPAGQTANDLTDLITAYTVSGVGSSSGGTITLTTPASAGDLITIVSDIPSNRTTDYQVSGDFVPATVNNDFDRMVSLAKQAEGLARRSLLFEESQQGVQAKALPKPDPGKIFSWDESGNVVYRSITDVATPIDINSTIDVYPHMADFITRTPTKDIIYVESYAVWSPGVTTPKGTHFRYKTGGTNTSPTVGSPVAVSTIGTGTQAGYAWTADGAEWFIVINGIIDVNSFATVQDAHNAARAGDVLFFPYGSAGYTFDLSITKSITIDLNGNDIYPATASGGIFRAAGALSGSQYQLSANAVRGQSAFTTTGSMSGISAGDLVLIRDNTQRPSDSAYINFEPHIVKSASGTSLVLETPLRFKKTAAASNVQKITPIEKITIKNGKLHDTSLQSNYGVFFQYCLDLVFENIEITDMSLSGIECQYSYNIMCKNIRYYDPRATGSNQGNGLVFVGCREIHFDILARGSRHAVDLASSFDVRGYGEATSGASVDLYVAHNSIGGFCDIKFKSFSHATTTARAVGASSQGVYSAEPDQYSVDVSDLNLDIELITDSRDSNQVPIYFEIPVVNSNIKVKGQCADGAGGATSINTQLIRFQPVENKNVNLNVESIGFDIAVNLSSVAAAERTPTDPNNGITIKKLNASAFHRGVSYDYATCIDVRSGELSSPSTSSSTIVYRSASNTELITRFRLDNLTISGDMDVHNLATSRMTTNCQGSFRGAVSDNNSGGFTVAAGWQLSQTDIFNNTKNETVYLTSAGSVTSATSAFLGGLFVGQRLTIFNSGSNNIIVQNAGIVVNSAGANLTIAANRAYTWVWAGALWTQV